MIRCSALPYLFSCSHFVEREHRSDSEPARLGNAAHEAMAAVVLGHQPNLTNIAGAWNVDERELTRLVRNGRATLVDLSLDGDVRVEESISSANLTGHPDLIVEWKEVVTIVDWKTGKRDRSYYHQLMGYAWVAMRSLKLYRLPFRLAIAWLDDGTVEQYDTSPAELEDWASKFPKPSGPRTVGEHCQHCASADFCPAQRDEESRALAFVGSGTFDVSTIDGTMVGTVHRQMRKLEALAESWRAAIKCRVIAQGPIDLGDGYSLSVVDEKGAREVDTLAAWDVLQSCLSDGELASVLKVKSSKLEDLVREKAGKGNGAGASRELWKALEDAGAVRRYPVQKLKEVRNQNVKGGKDE